MDALREPLERVVEATEWFVRTPSVRLLYVTTSAMHASAHALMSRASPCTIVSVIGHGLTVSSSDSFGARNRA